MQEQTRWRRRFLILFGDKEERLLTGSNFMRARVFQSLYCPKEKLGTAGKKEIFLLHLLVLLVNHKIADE